MSASQKLCSLYTTVTLSDCRKYIITILYIDHFNSDVCHYAVLPTRVVRLYVCVCVAVDADVVQGTAVAYRRSMMRD